MARKINRKPRATATGVAKAKASHSRTFMGLTVIEDALIDMGETIFLLDQIQAHGEAFDDLGRAYSRVARLIVADMATLRAEFDRAHAASAAGTPIERKAMECAQ